MYPPGRVVAGLSPLGARRTVRIGGCAWKRWRAVAAGLGPEGRDAVAVPASMKQATKATTTAREILIFTAIRVTSITGTGRKSRETQASPGPGDEAGAPARLRCGARVAATSAGGDCAPT